MNQITLVTNNEDWEGLYIDGNLTALDHQMSIKEFADLAGIDLDVIDADPDWFKEKEEILPDKLEDVKKK